MNKNPQMIFYIQNNHQDIKPIILIISPYDLQFFYLINKFILHGYI
jgi:hypothetical protein